MSGLYDPPEDYAAGLPLGDGVTYHPPRCPHCGGLMDTGFAIACRGGRYSERVALPPWCPSRACATERDERALARAIAAGVIDP